MCSDFQNCVLKLTWTLLIYYVRWYMRCKHPKSTIKKEWKESNITGLTQQVLWQSMGYTQKWYKCSCSARFLSYFDKCKLEMVLTVTVVTVFEEQQDFLREYWNVQWFGTVKLQNKQGRFLQDRSSHSKNSDICLGLWVFLLALSFNNHKQLSQSTDDWPIHGYNPQIQTWTFLTHWLERWAWKAFLWCTVSLILFLSISFWLE